MGAFSIWHWLVVGLLALLLFGGKGKISEMMGDVAKGIKSFKKGLAEDETVEAKPAGSVTDQTVAQQAAPQANASAAPPRS
ncbi:twin-arginine translocase TatA/TatE family subunit [Candidatus Raskinella chloraquaticus]|uniref:Sec-independent protein translocase protein TatA n=1 Tax=Candidatus Raskinella chloraquaticus TaxID=1951219 RepID=A0A1W9HVE0_9HYPH|nr:twin-arginine translocase TatA/TatE family subunit [Hyphomicrobiales bacterium]OQW51214.1 MAG: preprotein translocase subunit TatA [Proteobacteria bacterium SG_bin8]OQW85124.1 MAG: Sec-independent protein translocase TatA [Proteobacteria bacterium ST_bin15]